jgi:hypothetical protein
MSSVSIIELDATLLMAKATMKTQHNKRISQNSARAIRRVICKPE